MSYAQRIFEETKNMPEQQQQEVLDFALFLKQKRLDKVMDELITADMEALRELAK